MLQQCASRIVGFLYQGGSLDKTKSAIYQYGAELALSTAASIISILFLATLLGNFLWGLTFLIIFISMRLPGGGYHASSYRNCFILTNSVFLAAFALSALFLDFFSSAAAICLFGSHLVIWILAPIPNPHHPVSELTFHKNRNIVRGMVIAGTIFMMLIKFFLFWDSLFCISSASVTAVAVMMILAKKKRRN